MNDMTANFAAGGGDGPGIVGALIMFAMLVVALTPTVFMIITMWKILIKAGLPGWGQLIPIYNFYLYVKLGGKPGWWWILLLIPGVNVIIFIVLQFAIAKQFGKSGGFAVGLWLLPIVFYPILAFGRARFAA